ncbi:MAG: hypothetical protein ACKO1H_17325 [Tabrizicola sp.]
MQVRFWPKSIDLRRRPLPQFAPWAEPGEDMENQVLSLPWLPPYAVTRRSPLLLDEAFDDFDAQAERLVHHDQRYLQLTPGRFRGRFLSGIFGTDVALHVEVCD